MLQDIINKITVFEVDINACLSDKRNNLKVLKLIKFVVSESVYLAVWMQFQKLGQLVRKNENDKEIGKEEKKKRHKRRRRTDSQYMYTVASECELNSWLCRFERLNGIQWSWVQISFGPTLYSYI